ncbi:MAG: DUF4834 family protein [Flavobacteriaceae bacterium]|nr:DUF4834 family protein [Flavobacteriaceae bacterium]
MTFLKTILILLLVYFGLKILFQLAKPYLMRYLAKKVNQRFENAFGQSPFQTETSQAERASANYKTFHTNPTSKKKVGEYIDFEEIE